MGKPTDKGSVEMADEMRHTITIAAHVANLFFHIVLASLYLLSLSD